jgi:hypothetical protein
MRVTTGFGMGVLALALVAAGPVRSEASIGDPNTTFTAPANALVMPFDATDDWTSFLIVSNVAGTSWTGAEAVTTHWTFWSDSCELVADAWACLTLNDTVVVDPRNLSGIDAANEATGEAVDLSGERGITVVTAYNTDENCDPLDGELGLIDKAIVGSATRANTDTGYSFGNDAIGLGLDETGTYTRLPSGMGSSIDIISLNPATLQNSSVVMMALSESAGTGLTAEGEVGPYTDTISTSLTYYDNLEIPTTLPDVEFSCAAFASIGELTGDAGDINSSGFVRVSPVNDMGGMFVYALHGQAVGSYGGSNYGKYGRTTLLLDDEQPE